ncbi:RNA polymerase sigma-70 factor (ECF subfamily) [Prauserella shujinwangii]|uniref:RNA polymerase sigma-70 factor (ECF subfamily) n=1 Tax=Prauserella shujinwangii TaxID=1453103 RepID=A0A2T0LNE5_9PSEU|nr:sigma-70 family RNA polymerase sigma factor [Prauserella shujinwangii]PRX44700.1 RNA polymerase sigma-70 factor (ECF subfamily) [Prauserella shujinwangii]
MADGDRPDLASGDPQVEFARLFDAHARPLRAYLAGRVGADVADDLVAETFLLALRKRASYDPERAPVRGWLYGIATNLLRNHVRHEVRGFRATARAHGGSTAEHVEDHETRIAERMDAHRHVRDLAAALARLNKIDRDVLLLTSWAELEPSEVAEALGVPPSTVRSRLHRVRRRLRNTVLERHGEDGDA